MEKISDYYNALAPNYDQSRFGNSYGKFIDVQERRALVRMLGQTPLTSVLDLACGTGRLLDFAQTGCDLSPQMLEVAAKKYPGKTLVNADATSLPFEAETFEAVFSMHFFMHLDEATSAAVLAEAYRVLHPGGRFIFDFPSKKRRALTGGHHGKNWHGSSALALADVVDLGQGAVWHIVESQGILFFPIHRVPVFLRPILRPLDSFLCRSFLKEYASFLIVCLEKK